MDTLIVAGICFVLGWYCCNVVHLITQKYKLKKIEDRVNETLKDIREKIIPSRIEEVNGSLFLYNKETNEFLGQGKTLDDLESTVKLKYPNKMFNVSQAELDKYE